MEGGGGGSLWGVEGGSSRSCGVKNGVVWRGRVEVVGGSGGRGKGRRV